MISNAINVVIAVGSVWAWMALLMGNGSDEHLATKGIGSLKYYTVLSNLFSALASLAYLFSCLLTPQAPPSWVLVLKLASASVVLVTFFTTAFLLAPKIGRAFLYSGGNFWLHLVLPLLAAVDVCLFVPVGTLPFVATLAGVLFTAAYGTWYLGSVLMHGAEKDGKVYDFYHFLRWGRNKIWLVAAGMLGATWLFSLALYLVNRLV